MADNKPTVYLAGPIMFAQDGGHGWRDDLIDAYPNTFDWKNPLDEKDGSSDELTIIPEDMIEDYSPAPGEEVVSDAEVVEDDKRIIRESDAVFIGLPDNVHTWGTPQEQHFGFIREIPSFTWHGNLDWIDDCSPWLRYHSTYHSQDRDEIIRYMKREL